MRKKTIFFGFFESKLFFYNNFLSHLGEVFFCEQCFKRLWVDNRNRHFFFFEDNWEILFPNCPQS
uniref:Uncharacterized protein n=1 Tax=viral metagenome TaxID=1070528 RepID=A0A6C0JSZ6_9ZZZZ